jgi:F420H(2)-dependent quinone reductase
VGLGISGTRESWVGEVPDLVRRRRDVVTAGNAGSDRHPAWYYNLLANPDATVVILTRR